MAELFYCVRQRAGNLVKEYRGTMPPRYAPSDTDEDRRAKADLKAQRRTVLNRDSTDRLELMIALMGKYATHYILEFDNEHLPERFADVRKALRAFLRRVDGDTLANIAEEIADVGIMLDQMAIEFKVEDAVSKQRQYKAERLRERIDEIA